MSARVVLVHIYLLTSFPSSLLSALRLPTNTSMSSQQNVIRPLISLGPVDTSTVQRVKVEVTPSDKERLARVEARPPLSEILNLHDFEVGAVQ